MPSTALPVSESRAIPTHPQMQSELHDVVDYASGEPVPNVPWLTELPLSNPRVNLHCLSTVARITKRISDVVIASCLLLVLWPVMLLTAIAVKLTSRGPALFTQTRVGLNLRTRENDRRRDGEAATVAAGNRRLKSSDRRVDHAYGRHFTLYKFRTMRTDAEKNGAQFAVKGDRRVTLIGGFLRKSRLDELPQLWNVIKGEMSLVGPRPERPEFIEQLSDEIPDYLKRLGLKPGLTGIAQIVNGYDNDIESFRRKVAFDLAYLQNCCLWNDLKILFRTVGIVVTGRGAL